MLTLKPELYKYENIVNFLFEEYVREFGMPNYASFSIIQSLNKVTENRYSGGTWAQFVIHNGEILYDKSLEDFGIFSIFYPGPEIEKLRGDPKSVYFRINLRNEDDTTWSISIAYGGRWDGPEYTYNESSDVIERMPGQGYWRAG